MELKENVFKRRLKTGEIQWGLWSTMGDPYALEVSLQADFDWVLLDGEHGPLEVRRALAQLQVAESTTTAPILRPLETAEARVKQYLDLGAQTLLLPMINTGEDARAAVRSIHYPPVGVRGVGASVARAAKWGEIPHYMQEIDKQLCLLVQIESKQAYENLDEILAVEGIDGVFIGPADLSASFGETSYESSQMYEIYEDITRRSVAVGKAVGTLVTKKELVDQFVAWGATYIAVSIDVHAYLNGLRSDLTQYKE